MNLENLNAYVVKLNFSNEHTKTLELPSDYSSGNARVAILAEANNVNLHCKIVGSTLFVYASETITGNVHIQVIKT